MKGIWKKRVLALVTALCLVLPMGMTASAAGGFSDLRRSHWAYDEILDVVDKGLFLGTGEDTFGPEVEMSRAMFVTVLARLARAEVDDSKKSDFDDVAKNMWYTGAVNWAAKNGIVKGVSKDDFAPDRVITREEMATMIVRYTDYWDVTLPKDEKEIKFSDWRSISDFADDAVTACQRAGLLKGVGENRFDPKGTATRAQVATLISRLSDMDGTMVYVVSFDSNGGTDVDDQYVIDGKRATKPSGVRRSGYTLVGWYTDEKLTKTYSFSTKVTEDITLYAKWTRNSSSGGSSVTYYNPETAEPADMEELLTGGFAGLALTYPKMVMSGNEIQLSGVYTAGTAHTTAFPGDAYKEAGYVVPILLTAPSSYSGGDVTLTVTKDVADVTKTIKQADLDGEYYFYLLKYIPEDKPANWAPVITVNWNGRSITYTLNVGGMKKAEANSEAKIDGLDQAAVAAALTANETFKDLIPTYADVTVAKTGTAGTYEVYLSGGFAAQDKLPGFGEKSGYVVPIKLTAPDDYAGPVTVTATGGIEVKPLTAETEGVSDVTVLVYFPTSFGSGTAPVLKAEWTKAVATLNWLDRLNEKPEKTTLTYNLNVDGMRPIRSGGMPYVPTAEQQEAAAREYASNDPFRGISKFTAKTEFSAPSTSGGVTTIIVNAEAPTLIEGTEIPGFGIVGVDVPLTSFIFPIAFHAPDYMNLDAMKNTDTAVEYRIYPAGGPKAEVKTKTKAEVEDPFLLWKLVTPENLTALKNDGLRVGFAWFGGYTESFIFKLGNVTQQGGFTAQDPISGNATMAEATKNENDPFHGLESAVAQVKVEKQEGKFVISGTYGPWTQGQKVAGFGLAGDENVPLGGCVVPLAFPKPTGLDWSALAAGTVVQKMTTSKKAAEELEFTDSKVYSITKEARTAEDPFHFYYLLKDPKDAKGSELKVEIEWYNGFEESYTFVFGDLIPSNPAGEKFNLTAAEKEAISKPEGPFHDIKINQVAIAASTADNATTLRLTTRDQALIAEQVMPYYGQEYGPGYIVALKFEAPPSATQVTQTIKNGYTGAEQKKEGIALNGEKTHIILMYIPKTAKDSTYAPVIELTWSSADNMTKKETFVLDVVEGMGVAVPAVPEVVPSAEPQPESQTVEPQQEERGFWDWFRK